MQAQESRATPVTVDTVRATYSSLVGYEDHSSHPTSVSRQITQDTPLTDALLFAGSPGVPATATAGLWHVSAATDGTIKTPNYGYLSDGASARSVFEFSPLRDATATLGLDFIGTGETFYTEGLISLTDTTAQQSLWSYSWKGGLGNVPWLPPNYSGIGPRRTANITLDTALLSTHAYNLTMYTATSGDHDWEGMTIRMSGLQKKVPEPATLLLFGAGFAVMGLGRWRKQRLHPLQTLPRGPLPPQ
jgi:hypothetical protein